MKAILREVAHRPWPLPADPWVMAQSWHDLLFAHWPVDAKKLRALIPDRLEIDSFDGQAWLAVVPFRMTALRHSADVSPSSLGRTTFTGKGGLLWEKSPLRPGSLRLE